MADVLLKLLQQHNLDCNSIQRTRGDTVVRYRIEVDPYTFRGIDKFTALEQNIAYLLNLTEKPIVTPDYESGCVVIDTITNLRTFVELPDVLPQLSWYQRHLKRDHVDIEGQLPMIVGRDVDRNPAIVDLAELPHLLVAGTTGSGKSVGLKTMITSLLHLRPKTQFVFLDPKGVELDVFSDLKYSRLFTQPGIPPYALSDPDEIYDALCKIYEYVESMFDVLQSQGKTKVSELDNPQYVVVVIDELADIVTRNKKASKILLQIAQKSRAAGVHIIAATQRPSVDIVDGTIKANFPGRIAFKVSSKQDSITILGRSGAESLLGRGDMLYRLGPNRFERIQGAYASDKTIKKILKQRKIHHG